jgi:hypothetical protein
VLTQAVDASPDTIAPTATDTLTQTAAPDEAAASAEALTQVAPTPSLTFEQHIVRLAACDCFQQVAKSCA